jgi:hypothetical protein
MLSVTYKRFMLSVVNMLSVFTLNVVMMSVGAPSKLEL